eukprot:CAMPEP_0206463844 /NCGR_PEP_ID=MMETSP0324_2-20121206/26856_1 /ASSEMBLY_ACC=CAM_ASM_000836 /TAXON_ID=2866 /ORGANISM="Crypthecodinium cohnii, Strain Seligo" /LENGTH=283 /DNA_ID=CAMNT_0053936349 /DNA_START=106 /DNA_END=958 /DNA_ORIENTATION=+
MLSSSHLIDHSENGEAEPWDQNADLESHSMLADPYPAPEPTRGVAFELPSVSSGGFNLDHPWGADDDLQWTGDKFSSCVQGFGNKSNQVSDFDMFFDDEAPPPPPAFFSHLPTSATAASSTAAAAAAAAVERFQASDVAPRLSAQPLAQIEPTHSEHEVSSPAALGNALLECLSSLHPEEPLEVNRDHFTVMASFSCGFATCSMKFYIFEAAQDRYLLETTRWMGDSLYFVSIFQRLQGLLKDKLDEASSIPAAHLDLVAAISFNTAIELKWCFADLRAEPHK